MATNVRYYAGGHDAAAPQQNRAAQWDGPSGKYTAWAPDGTVSESRPLTTDEAAGLAAADAQNAADTNGNTLRVRSQAALAANATYLALANPSTAQNTAQVKALTRQTNALIRLLTGRLDDTAGT